MGQRDGLWEWGGWRSWVGLDLGGGVESGLKLGRSNNAVKAFLNIVNIPKPAAVEVISGERCPRSRRVIQVYAAVTELATLEIWYWVISQGPVRTHSWVGHSQRAPEKLSRWCQQKWHFCARDIGWVSVFRESIGDYQVSQRPDSGKPACERVNERGAEDERSQPQFISSHPRRQALLLEEEPGSGRLTAGWEVLGPVCERGQRGEDAGLNGVLLRRWPTAPQSAQRVDQGLLRCWLKPQFLITRLLFTCGGWFP